MLSGVFETDAHIACPLRFYEERNEDRGIGTLRREGVSPADASLAFRDLLPLMLPVAAGFADAITRPGQSLLDDVGHKMLIDAIPKAGDKPVENQAGAAGVAASICLPKFRAQV
jgi:hypothetical protein